MTTAPTPAAAAIADLLEYLDDGGLHFDGQPLPDAAAIELRRLQAESERLQGSLEAQRLISDRAIALAKELEASKNASIHKLEMDALDLASENSILKRAETDELEARKSPPLSDEQIDAIGDKCGKPSATWHYEFARAIERRITGGSS